MNTVWRVVEWVLVHVILRALVAVTIVLFVVYVAPLILVWLVGK